MKKIIAYGMPFMDFLVNIDHLPTGKNDGARIRKTSWHSWKASWPAQALLSKKKVLI